MNTLQCKDVVYVQPSGGLGNQLFQVSAAYALAKRLDAPLRIVTRSNETEISKNFDARSFCINNKYFYLENIEFISQEEFKKINCLIVGEIDIFDDHKGKGNIILNGYFESEEFFKEYSADIKKMFTQKNIRTPFIEKHLPEIKNCNSVAVHIRRGDIRKDTFRTLPMTYYVEAMKIFSNQKDVKFFVFTDDPVFAKECFQNLDNIEVITDGTATNLEELYLMSQCKHMIMANSTFSWWAAYLNSNSEKLKISWWAACLGNNTDTIIVAPFPKFCKDEDFLKRVYHDGPWRKFGRWIHTEVPFPSNWKTLNPFVFKP